MKAGKRMESIGLNGLPLFKGFTPAQMTRLEQIFQPELHTFGDVLFEQDDPAVNIYLVIEGEVVVRYKPYDGPAMNVARVRPLGVVGWSAALGSKAYTSSAVCTSESWLLKISGEDLRQLCISDPQTGGQVLERLADVIAERLRSTHTQVMAMLEAGLNLRIRPLVV
jgi:CRP-like cAMP-binding protein